MTIYRNWKDRWTGFWWRFLYPGEAVPVDILPSYYAELEKQDPKKNMPEVLTKAVCLDMEMYPNHWVRKDPRWSFDDTKYVNKEANVTISLPDLGNSCKINDYEVGEKNRKLIIEAWNKRWAADTLERIIDRIEKVQTVTCEDVIEEVRPQLPTGPKMLEGPKEVARPKLVDPFAELPIETIARHMSELHAAAERGRAMLPPPKQLIGPSSSTKTTGKQLTTTSVAKPRPKRLPAKCKKLQPGPHLTQGSSFLKLPHVATWKGKPAGKLSDSEFNDMLEYISKHPGSSGFIPNRYSY